MGAHFCPACGHEAKGSNFCPECGASTSVSASRESPWVGPMVWTMFLGGIALMVAGAGSTLAMWGLIVTVLGFGGIIATGRIWPGRT